MTQHAQIPGRWTDRREVVRSATRGQGAAPRSWAHEGEMLDS
jgi:hypothetical protein